MYEPITHNPSSGDKGLTLARDIQITQFDSLSRKNKLISQTTHELQRGYRPTKINSIY